MTTTMQQACFTVKFSSELEIIESAHQDFEISALSTMKYALEGKF